MLNFLTLGRRCLRGRTNVGDSVEDEWLIVYILRELSKSFTQIWVTIVDTDGQFLLIEAANALPKWLNPEVADFRVWINSGKLLIIPTDQPGYAKAQKASQPGVLSLDDALRFLQHNETRLLHLPSVEMEAFYRLQKYPKQISDNLHHARIILPRNLAHILHHNPSYISPAIEAFYLRDPIALRPLQACDTKDLKFVPTDCVNVSVKFTKIGYAQLKSQSYDPPPMWKDFQAGNGNMESQETINMGMKVACGFEMLISDPQNQDKKVVREIKLLLEDLEAGADQLPSDGEISKWQMIEDNESWLDINFEDFEQELAGNKHVEEKIDKAGFGDRNAQEHLRKMVARFQGFLNDDDAAGVEGAEYADDMDNDNDEDSTSSEDTEVNDGNDVDFNEEHFAQMMREMLGMASTSAKAGDNKQIENLSGAQSGGIPSDWTEGEDEEGIFQNMHEIERELLEAGALDVRSKQPSETSRLQQGYVNESNARAPGETDAEDEDVEVDINLAKNLLESFESQGGLPGPTSNLLGLMGLLLPRDEDRGG